MPADGVVTDRTAAFLHCAEHALAPGDHLAVPGVSVFRAPGYRLRNPVSDSGERTLGARDVQVVHGVRCTTPLRTMADLGRLLHRDQAFAAMCALARASGVSREQLCADLPRYAGYRGVVQLRELASLVEPGAESPGESISLLRCHDVGIRAVVAQHVVLWMDGGHYRLDLAVPDLMLAVEYDGEESHGPEQQQADEDRRAWLRARGWLVVVLRRDNVHGPYQDAETLLRRAYDLALARTPLG